LQPARRDSYFFVPFVEVVIAIGRVGYLWYRMKWIEGFPDAFSYRLLFFIHRLASMRCFIDLFEFYVLAIGNCAILLRFFFLADMPIFLRPFYSGAVRINPIWIDR
jgi:hypothetical protein